MGKSCKCMQEMTGAYWLLIKQWSDSLKRKPTHW